MPEQTLEDQIRAAAKTSGVTAADLNNVQAPAPAGAGATLGDGVLLGKFIDLLKILGPIIAPLLAAKEQPTPVV